MILTDLIIHLSVRLHSDRRLPDMLSAKDMAYRIMTLGLSLRHHSWTHSLASALILARLRNLYFIIVSEEKYVPISM